ncbi:MAG: hypothetical protein DI629_21235 [Mesorhizobium amorphae]|nr:MAG: hypothetical protein DI629_21235 [Mesorhizobium amorphae]
MSRRLITVHGLSADVVVTVCDPGERYGARGGAVNEAGERLVSFHDAPAREAEGAEPEGRFVIRMTESDLGKAAGDGVLLDDGFPPFGLTADGITAVVDALTHERASEPESGP